MSTISSTSPRLTASQTVVFLGYSDGLNEEFDPCTGKTKPRHAERSIQHSRLNMFAEENIGSDELQEWDRYQAFILSHGGILISPGSHRAVSQVLDEVRDMS
jgi:hypothetical protein